MKKLRVGIVFGGRSAEHEVALQSAKNIIAVIDKNKYDLVLIGIDRQGQWYLNQSTDFLLNSDDPRNISLKSGGKNLAVIPGDQTGPIVETGDSGTIGDIDVVFPVLHGPYGEDGSIQGLLRLADIPFVGADVLGSAISMDKDVMKRLLRDAGIPHAAFKSFKLAEKSEINFSRLKSDLGLPFFVKPANLGSSVGISKVHNQEELLPALDLAFKYDKKIIIEENISGRELECAVLGNDDPIASVAGEVLPAHEFYSYEAKYLDAQGARLQIPADISKDIEDQIKKMAVSAFKVLDCAGMARVDFFLRGDSELLVNELNTIPGFTRISMYPKLWEASGIPYSELIDRLINLALERAKDFLEKTF
jgi:D-alanine-D-alanine ligase